MSVSKEFTVGEFLGLNERGNDVVGSKEGANYARVLSNFRPDGGLLRKASGCTWHSVLNYKAAAAVKTLLRYSTDTGTRRFIATAWDAVFNYSANAWASLCSEGQVVYSDWWLIPPNLLQGEFAVAGHANRYYSYLNRPFDWMIYKDLLYLTDGYNVPVKTNGTIFGEWGYRSFSSITTVLIAQAQTAGVLAAGTYTYRLSLYDSTRDLEGNYSTATLSYVSGGGAGSAVWIYVDMVFWAQEGNYDFENEFANRIRIYRNESAAVDDMRLAATLRKGLVSYGTATVAIVGPDAILTDAAGTFDVDSVAAAYAVYIIGVGTYQANVITPTTITLTDSDGSAYSGGAIAAETAYRIFAGYIDNVADLTTAAQIYHNDEDNPAREDHAFPARCRYCAGFADKTMRAFLAGDPANPNRIYYSDLDLPDYFPTANFYDFDPDDGDQITGLIKFQGRLYVFKHRSVGVMTVDGDPFTWTFTPRVLSVGASSRRTIVDCDGLLIFASEDGVYSFDGGQVTDISHNESGSNIIQTWEKIVAEEVQRAEACYVPPLREYWLSVSLDDERGLYVSGLSGLGNILESTTQVGSDGGTPSQNNMTLCYRVATGQWYLNPDMRASAWAVWRGLGDQGWVFRSGAGSSVFRENVGETRVGRSGDSGQATDGAATTLTDGGATWTVNEWAGATVYLHPYGTDIIESANVVSNTATVLTCDTFSIGGAAWSANPVLSDYYIIVLSSAAAGITMRYKTPKLAMGTLAREKAFIEMVVRAFGDGVLTVAWTVNEEHGGTLQFTLGQTGLTRWGTHDWGTADDGATLIWTEVETVIQSDLFDVDAEGVFIELEFTASASFEFYINYWLLRLLIQSGAKWLH